MISQAITKTDSTEIEIDFDEVERRWELCQEELAAGKWEPEDEVSYEVVPGPDMVNARLALGEAGEAAHDIRSLMRVVRDLYFAGDIKGVDTWDFENSLNAIFNRLKKLDGRLSAMKVALPWPEFLANKSL